MWMRCCPVCLKSDDLWPFVWLRKAVVPSWLYNLLMPGESDLSALLARMTPELHGSEYVFCSVAPDVAEVLRNQALGCFEENEGVSLILERTAADQAGLAYDSVWKMISLTVHSSLEAVGFLAALTTRLASAGISANVVSAFFHDHLFVPVSLAEKAMAVLLALQHRDSGKRDQVEDQPAE